MSDIAKTQRPWFAERFVISRPEVVEHLSDAASSLSSNQG